MLSLGVSFADVAITGHLDQAFTSLSNSESGKVIQTNSGIASIMAPSFITFSGNEDLGSGLKAVFKFENGLAMNSASLLSDGVSTWNGGKSGKNREAWVGLGGEFGEVKLGNQYVPAFWTVLTIDPGALNNAPGVLAAGQFGIASVNNGTTTSILGMANANATTYTSPSFSGVTLSAQIQSGIGNTADSTVGDQGNGFGYGLTYAAGPLYASVAYNSTKVTDTHARLSGGTTTLTTSANYYTDDGKSKAGDSASFTVVGVSYDFGMAKVGYLSTRSDLNSYSTTSNMGAITVPYGAASFGYSYSSGSVNGSTTTNQNGQQLNITYNFSKRTNAYLAYGVAKDTTHNDSYSVNSIGIAHSF